MECECMQAKMREFWHDFLLLLFSWQTGNKCVGTCVIRVKGEGVERDWGVMVRYEQYRDMHVFDSAEACRCFIKIMRQHGMTCQLTRHTFVGLSTILGLPISYGNIPAPGEKHTAWLSHKDLDNWGAKFALSDDDRKKRIEGSRLTVMGWSKCSMTNAK